MPRNGTRCGSSSWRCSIFETSQFLADFDISIDDAPSALVLVSGGREGYYKADKITPHFLDQFLRSIASGSEQVLCSGSEILTVPMAAAFCPQKRFKSLLNIGRALNNVSWRIKNFIQTYSTGTFLRSLMAARTKFIALRFVVDCLWRGNPRDNMFGLHNLALSF